jgi:hypothetical protein
MSLRPLIRLLFALALLCGLAGGARATNTCVTCYVDYVNGLDTYDGTSKTHTSGTVGPWKHAPGMLGLNQTGGSTGDGCASNCLAQVPLPGDKYILRGGTTWPYTVLPWLWTWSGTSSTQTFGCAGTGCIYIGIDATWQTGVVNALVPTKSAGGCNPSSPPTVALTGGGGIGAAATATIMPAAVNGGTYGGGGGGEPQVNGMLLYYSMGAQGSSYTSNPTATITQNGCNLETAVADIYRAVIDGGLKSGIIWPVGQNASNAWDFPGVGLGTAGSPVSYVIVDNLEIRNFLQAPRGVGTGNPDTGFAVSLLSDSSLSQHNTFSNNYVHYRTVSSCFSGCGSPQGGTGDLIMDLASYNDEAANNWLSNSESFFLGTSTTDCPLNWPCMFSASGLNAYYGGNANNGGGSIHGNHIWGARWLMEVSGFQGVSGTPVYVYGNDAWLALYDINTQPHVNGFYFQIGTATLYEYNNYLHNVVNGTNNQQAPGNPGVQYFFNNVSWQAAGGGNYGITGYGLGANGAHLYFLQNTMYASGTTGAPNACISSDNANPTDNPYLYVILQNNHCMTNYGPPWFADAAVGSTWQTSAGSTNVTDIENGTSVQTWSGSTAYYSPATLFAPQSSAAPTVTFATGGNSYNFYSICNGQPNPGLGALCFDINGNARPSTGGWNAGAYQQLSSGSVTLSPSPESFGNVNYGSSSSGVTFTLTNNSSASATSLSIGNSGGNAGDFAISSNTCGSTLAASASCTWVVTFTPGIIGSRYTTLSATYSGGDGAGSQSSLLTGVGAGTSTVNYTNVHQVIDGFGASNAQNCSSPGSMSSSVQNFFFNFLGLSIYRAGIPDNSTCFPGDCTSVSIGCASNYILDMQAQVAAGGIIYASDWSPPAIYKTNSSVNCSPGNGALATASYANYATLLANFVQSVQTYAGVTIAALSPQNEPNTCATYDSASVERSTAGHLHRK